MIDESPIELVCLGELLIDFVQVDEERFLRNPGGAPANVAAQAAKLGMRAKFVGKVGKDMHGDFLRERLQRLGVDASSVAQDPDAFTTLAFVHVDKDTGERSFSFARKPGADTRLSPGELPVEALRSCRALHVGSLSLTDEPARSATLRAVEIAKEAGALISYDPNYRASLWPSETEALERMSSLLGKADLVKLSEEEAGLLCGTADAERAARLVLARGAGLVAITLGAEGAFVATRAASARIPAIPCFPRNTTAAGDAFWGALLYKVVHERGARTASDLAALSAEDLYAIGRFANAASARCIECGTGMYGMGKKGGLLGIDHIVKTGMSPRFAQPANHYRIVDVSDDRAAHPELLDEMTDDVWEPSVRATHTFLNEGDIQAIRPEVYEGLAHVDHLLAAVADDTDGARRVLGLDRRPPHGIVAFAGIQDGKLEMLFCAPQAMRHGIGGSLVSHAVDTWGVRSVDVNEQNPDAVAFYERMGFEVASRSPLDDAGRPFPVLHMTRGSETLEKGE